MATKRIITKKSSPAKSSSGKAPNTGVAATRGRAEELVGKNQSGKKVSGPGWAGEVLLEGIKDADKEAILGLIRHTAGTGPRDEADRVVKIESGKGKLRVLTAQNALAVSIGKRVHRSHKGGVLQITWSHDDLPVRVRWTAPSGKK